jgi:hypothetical protein
MHFLDKYGRLITTICGILIIVAIVLLGSNFIVASQTVDDFSKIEFIGKDTLPTGFSFQGTEVGGLSGITYNTESNLYYAISDDRGAKAPARFYTLKIDLSQGKLNQGGVSLIKVTPLLDENGQAFPPGSTDTEGIAVTNKDTVFITSEGSFKPLIHPFVREFSLTSGKLINTLSIPQKFLPRENPLRGVRNNLAFESLTITGDRKTLFTATENALFQDGEAAKPGTGSSCRILKYNLLTNQPEQEFLYQTEFASGLTDLLALDNHGRLLSLERSFNGWGFTILLFEVSGDRATDIHGIDSIRTTGSQKITSVKKKLLWDLSRINSAVDNIEGLSFGPILPDGNPSLILVSDNNFNRLQRTQILAFKIRLDI